MASVRFSATTVVFATPPETLARALASLGIAVARAREAGLLASAEVWVVDNGEGSRELAGACRQAWPAAEGPLEVIAGQGNVGYGRANNLALARAASEVHLVMNPDVELDPEALVAALGALVEHPEVGLVAPSVRGEDGATQYLCKRYPSVWVLFLRGFAPRSLRRRHAGALDHYEMRDVPHDQPFAPVTIASGCFMLMRTPLFARLGGFDPRFFMYFEDFDLSLRAGREATVAYVPAARIVHHGGEASRKGLRHVVWFLRSAWRFFAIHGWKLS